MSSKGRMKQRIKTTFSAERNSLVVTEKKDEEEGCIPATIYMNEPQTQYNLTTRRIVSYVILCLFCERIYSINVILGERQSFSKMFKLPWSVLSRS